MADMSRNLGASSSTSVRELEEKRKQDATRDEEAKKQRHSQLDVTAHPNGADVPVVPLHYAASNAMAMAFPMVGVNGAVLRWSTAATLGAARRAAASSLPGIAGVNGPAAPFVLAPVFSLQAQPLQFISGPPAPTFGLPLAAALDKIMNDTLRRMLSALMPACNPPMEPRQSWTGAPPPWWPTASEDWWALELVAHLDTRAMHMPVPFAPAYKLKKVEKVAVLVAIVKHLAPKFDMIYRKVSKEIKLSDQENKLWKSALKIEAARCESRSVRPKTPVLMWLQQQPHGDGHRQAPSRTTATATESVVHGGIAAADGCEQVVNLAGASMTAPADDGGQVVAAVEAQHDNGVLHRGVVATDAMADGGPQQPINIPDDDGDAPLSDYVHQVAAEPELQPEQHGDMHVDAATADMDQLLDDMLAPYQMQQGEEVHQAVDVEVPGAEAAVEEAPEARPWYVEEDRSSIFDDFEPVGTPHSYYY